MCNICINFYTTFFYDVSAACRSDVPGTANSITSKSCTSRALTITDTNYHPVAPCFPEFYGGSRNSHCIGRCFVRVVPPPRIAASPFLDPEYFFLLLVDFYTTPRGSAVHRLTLGHTERGHRLPVSCIFRGLLISQTYMSLLRRHHPHQCVRKFRICFVFHSSLSTFRYVRPSVSSRRCVLDVMEPPVTELTNLLRRWEDELTNSSYNPVPLLTR